ncbi:hypothetical protein K505DRAFT_365878 [Melanomma pulvis-pyrius CBS 109.77]|uniref:Uncharacterized protein n=1 Tax=Melanomma pulvis-pyrius CBS 109.77 TaxID=1314802 RepID=A0A6A6WZ07_9PLEO|nr:hypothetical protein K505DRAFT_365878 [Melanomma pulvis-pyrius CBS 109.77]
MAKREKSYQSIAEKKGPGTLFKMEVQEKLRKDEINLVFTYRDTYHQLHEQYSRQLNFVVARALAKGLRAYMVG